MLSLACRSRPFTARIYSPALTFTPGCVSGASGPGSSSRRCRLSRCGSGRSRRVIGAEQTRLYWLRLGLLAAADEHVADRHLAEHLLEQVREFVARRDADRDKARTSSWPCRDRARDSAGRRRSHARCATSRRRSASTSREARRTPPSIQLQRPESGLRRASHRRSLGRRSVVHDSPLR